MASVWLASQFFGWVFTLRSLLILISLVGTIPAIARGQNPADRPATVRTATATTRELNRTQSFIGTLQPIRRAIIGSAVEDRVLGVLIDEGHEVVGPAETGQAAAASGQTLVEIDTSSIDIEYAAAKIEFELSEQALRELEFSLPVEIELAEAKLNQARAQNEYAQSVYRRLQELGQTAAVKEREESFSLYKTQAQALIAAEAEFKRLESTREIRLLIARKNVAAREAELRRLTDLRNKYTITAPFSGFVTRVLVERGNWVTRGTPVVEMVQLDPIEMRVNVPQEYLANLQQTVAQAPDDAGPAVEIRVESLPRSFAGVLTEIIPQADERTRAVPVVIRIPNPRNELGHVLYPGLLAEAALNVGQRETALMVPKDALVLGQSSTVIYVVDDSQGQPLARRVQVQTGSAVDGWIAVTGAVQDGDTVVTEGNERLRDGQALQVVSDDSRS